MAEMIKFYRVNEPYGCFSNFSKHPIFVETTWPTSEHFFQAQKFLDQELRMKILLNPSPMEAARMGRNREIPIRADWEAVKDDIMRTAIRAKVAQHADVRETLLSTGDATIVEHTSNDRYWADGGDGSGKNMLGKILMEVRDELNTNGPFDELATPMMPPWEKYPELPRGSMGWRMGYGEDYATRWSLWYGGLTEEGKGKYRRSIAVPEQWRDWID